MPNKPINAYEATLLQKIFLIEYSVEDNDKRRPTEVGFKDNDYDNIGTDVGVSGDTIQKIFGRSHNPGYLFQSTKLDTIIKKLKLWDLNSWDDFLIKFPPLGFVDPSRIPNGQIVDLNKELQEKIKSAVIGSLHKLYKDHPKKAELITQIEFDKFEDKYLGKLNDYTNTKWYAYFCFTVGERYPKIIRSVIEIGNPPNVVKSNAAKYEGFDDFSGTARLSSDEKILIFDMKSEGTQERELRIMVLIGAGKRPDIALGEYLNIGRRGMGSHSPRIILQYIDRVIDPKPTILDAGHPEFQNIPEAIRKFLHRQDPNLRLISGAVRISTEHGLLKFAEEEEKHRFQDRRVRLSRSFQVILTSPRYSKSLENFKDKYEQPLNEIKNYLEGIKVGGISAFEVKDYYLDADPKPKIPRPYSFYSNRIYHCEIVIALLFDQGGSVCESELTLAAETGRTVHILTTENKEYLPKIFYREDLDGPKNIGVHNYFATPDEAVNWLKNDTMIFGRELSEIEKYVDQSN